MKYHEILGVTTEASKEEIREAYERKVSEIHKEVKNEKNAEAFISILTEAYEKLINIDHTQPITIESINEEMSKDNNQEDYYEEDDDYRDGQVVDYDSFFDEDDEDDEDEDDDFTFVDRIVEKFKDKRKKNNSHKKKEKKKSSKKHTNKFNDLIHENESEEVYEDYDEDDSKEQSILIKVLLLPIKIVLLPIALIILLLTVLFKIISLITWAVAKVLLVGSIAIISIHGYQVYKGAIMNKKIMATSIGVAFASIMLPLTIKSIYKILSGTNDCLLEFIF